MALVWRGLDSSTMSTDLLSIGLGFDTWQEAVEAAIASNRLAVTGEVRGGQLIQFEDPSGAQMNILAVEPFATFASFEASTQVFANLQMMTDVVAMCDIVDGATNPLGTVMVNLAQGPLLTEEPPMEFQQMGLTALCLYSEVHGSDVEYENETGQIPGFVQSPGAELVASGAPQAPDASVIFAATVLEAEYRTSQLTGQRFIHATVDGPFAFDVCLPNLPQLPEPGNVIAGKAVLSGSLLAPVGGGCGGCGGSCGCGEH